MPKYIYKAIAEDGTVIKGEVFSETMEELVQVLSSQGLVVTKLSRSLFSGFIIKPRLEALLLFLKEYTVLLRSGLSVQDALQITARARGTYLGGILSQIRYDVLRGKRLSLAFSKLADTFDPLLLSVVATGERTGKLVETLKNYEALLARKIELQRKVRHALIYPVFVLFVVLVIFIVIFQFSLPRFIQIYTDLDAALPASTNLLLFISGNFSYFASGFIVLAILSWQTWRYIRNKNWLTERLHRYSLSIPVVGEIQRSYNVSLFARTLSSLLATGTPLVEAIQHTAKSLPNRYQSHCLAGITRVIARGESLTMALSRAKILPPAAEKIIEAGERAGSLEGQLTELAEFYENDIEYRLDLAVSLIEPLLILVTGIIVGGVVLVMYLPIFNLAGAIA